jgi:hypothetical protein
MTLNTPNAVNSTRTDRIEHENRYATRVKSEQVGATKLQEVKKHPIQGKIIPFSSGVREHVPLRLRALWI